MAQFAEADRVEQMNAQRRRLKVRCWGLVSYILGYPSSLCWDTCPECYVLICENLFLDNIEQHILTGSEMGASKVNVMGGCC